MFAGDKTCGGELIQLGANGVEWIQGGAVSNPAFQRGCCESGPPACAEGESPTGISRKQS